MNTKQVEQLAEEKLKHIQYLVIEDFPKNVQKLLKTALVEMYNKGREEGVEVWLTNIIRSNGSQTDISRAAKTLKDFLSSKQINNHGKENRAAV